ncbi:uncharacterized protein LOC123263477 isoform X1 [Cotesia glomerata]|uniref:uncharacterized protein LOC123263477 isoform X1 n=1 Tax=Cotesia glomerata TaxID=32391 RepID=UPI001D01D309|nr:uncharacterized protein LOC123263477 isoform X1 [Cotesia glomerata]
MECCRLKAARNKCHTVLGLNVTGSNEQVTVAAWALIAHQVQRQTELIRWLRGRSTVVYPMPVALTTVNFPFFFFFKLWPPLHRHVTTTVLKLISPLLYLEHPVDCRL